MPEFFVVCLSSKSISGLRDETHSLMEMYTHSH